MRVTQGAPGETRPWRLSLAWLAFLGPFFFASYGFANWSAAQRELNVALREAPQNADVHNLLGYTYRKRAAPDLARALEHYQAALRIDPAHKGAHEYIGEEAIAVGVCSALKPTDVIASTHRGHGHIIAKGGDVRRGDAI